MTGSHVLKTIDPASRVYATGTAVGP
jgi:hypothetical protein